MKKWLFILNFHHFFGQNSHLSFWENAGFLETSSCILLRIYRSFTTSHGYHYAITPERYHTLHPGSNRTSIRCNGTAEYAVESENVRRTEKVGM